jgi:hypothetical protein
MTSKTTIMQTWTTMMTLELSTPARLYSSMFKGRGFAHSACQALSLGLDLEYTSATEIWGNTKRAALMLVAGVSVG